MPPVESGSHKGIDIAGAVGVAPRALGVKQERIRELNTDAAEGRHDPGHVVAPAQSIGTHLGKGVEHSANQAGEYLVLALEVVIEGHVFDIELFANAAHAKGVDSFTLKDFHRGVEDTLPRQALTPLLRFSCCRSQ